MVGENQFGTLKHILFDDASVGYGVFFFGDYSTFTRLLAMKSFTNGKM